MPALVAGIHVFLCCNKGVDGRVKPGHDERELTLKPHLPTEPNRPRPIPMLAIRMQRDNPMTMAEMTEPATQPLAGTAPAASAPRHLGLRAVLIIAALLEAYDGYSNVSTLFGDMSEIPGPGFGGFLIKAHIATHVPLALAALLFAAIGNVRYAIMALGAIVFMTWLNYLPSGGRIGFGLDDLTSLEPVARMIGFPLMAACAIALAARNRRLGIATVLVSIPTFWFWGGVIAFAISVSLYGF